MLNQTLETNCFGIEDMFYSYCKKKELESNDFYLKINTQYKKHKLYFNNTKATLINVLQLKKNFLNKWLLSLLTKSVLDHEDKFHISILPQEIDNLKDRITHIRDESNYSKVYMTYENYNKIIKTFNINLQQRVIEGDYVKIKGLGTLVVAKVPVSKDLKFINWKETNLKKKSLIENNTLKTEDNLTGESPLVYYTDRHYYKLLFLRNHNLQNIKYYSFRVTGGKTREGSKSFTYNMYKHLGDETKKSKTKYWEKVDCKNRIDSKYDRSVMRYKKSLSTIEEINLD